METIDTLPALSTLSDACHEVTQPSPKMPGVERPASNVWKVRSMASVSLPGTGSDASTTAGSVGVGNDALACDSRNEKSRPTLLTSAVVSPRLLR